MSREHVEVVRELLSRWKAGDPALKSFSDDAVWDYTAFPDGRVVQGHAEIARFMRRWLGTWAQYELHVDDVLDAGDQVVALTRERGRGKGSDVHVDLQAALLFSLSGGKVVRFKGYLDRAEALEAAGLSA